MSCQNCVYSLHLLFKIGFMSSLSIIFCISKFSRILKNWIEDSVTFSVKKRHAERRRYEKSALHKFFLYKFSTKCTAPIFNLVEIEAVPFLAPILCATFGVYRPFPVIWDATWLYWDNFVFTIYRKEGKLRPRWQAEKHFGEVFILISLLLTSLGNSMLPIKFLSPHPLIWNITISFKYVV